MQTRTGYTQYVQWNVICRAAMILGVVDDISKKSNCLRINAILKKRMASRKVTKRKTGPSQSHHAYYAAKYPR